MPFASLVSSSLKSKESAKRLAQLLCFHRFIQNFDEPIQIIFINRERQNEKKHFQIKHCPKCDKIKITPLES